jgi:hypothetical protein
MQYLWARGDIPRDVKLTTYERIFNERMTDLLWVCKQCHRELDDAVAY